VPLMYDVSAPVHVYTHIHLLGGETVQSQRLLNDCI
jgi:hypothetical protein